MNSRRFAWLSALGSGLVALAPAVSVARDSGLSAEVRGREIRATACRGARCEPAQFTMPEGVGAARVETFTLTGGRAALLVEAPAEKGAGRFVVLVAEDDAGAPRELLRGWVDRPRTSSSDAAVRVLLRDRGANGETVSFATRTENAFACGRHVFTRVQTLDPRALEWRPAATRALSPSERESAQRLFAVRGGPFDPALPRLLSATLATSSSSRGPSVLTDASIEHGWSEGVEGTGRGEAVVFSSSSDVPILGFEVVSRPISGVLAAPRTFHLVTDSQVFHVTMPEDAALQPSGTRYDVALPQAVRTECAALVLDDAYAATGDATGLVEVRAKTAFDAEPTEALVARLDRGGFEARAVETLLSRGGPDAVRAAIRGFDGLGPAGRERAFDVIDSGTCDQTARFLAERLVGRGRDASWDADGDDDMGAVRERVRRCRVESVPVLEELVLTGRDDRERGLAARELAAVAPTHALVALPRAFAGASAPLRARLRDGLFAASRDPRSHGRVDAVFAPESFRGLPRDARVEVLRALGALVGELPSASGVLSDLLDGATFRDRYLLAEPAAELARRGDARATAFLAELLSRSDSPELRARAASVGGRILPLQGALAAALEDPSPRVREAALTSCASGAQPLPSARIAALLRSDRWTFVRGAAASALGAQPLDEVGADALVGALSDQALAVRTAAVHSAGARRLAAAGDELRAISGNARLEPSLRSAALVALGGLCRAADADFFYKLAERTVAPELGYDRELGASALVALAKLQPSDRRERLMPMLRDARTPREVKLLIRRVVESPGRCGS